MAVLSEDSAVGRANIFSGTSLKVIQTLIQYT
jgi:hypothetical protein